MKADQTMLTTDDLARRWDMNPKSLITWRCVRKGPPFVKLGKYRGAKVLYKLTDIMEYEKRMTVNTKDGR